MSASGIVEAIYVFEDGDLGGSACLPEMPPYQSALMVLKNVSIAALSEEVLK